MDEDDLGSFDHIRLNLRGSERWRYATSVTAG